MLDLLTLRQKYGGQAYRGDIAEVAEVLYVFGVYGNPSPDTVRAATVLLLFWDISDEARKELIQDVAQMYGASVASKLLACMAVLDTTPFVERSMNDMDQYSRSLMVLPRETRDILLVQALVQVCHQILKVQSSTPERDRSMSKYFSKLLMYYDSIVACLGEDSSAFASYFKLTYHNHLRPALLARTSPAA